MSGNKIKVSIVYSMLGVDLLIIAICFQLSLYFRFRTFRFDTMSQMEQMGALLVFLLVGAVFTFLFEPNRDFLKRGAVRECYEAGRLAGAVTGGALVLLYMLRIAELLSRLFMAYFLLLCFLFVLIVHLCIREALRHYFVKTDAATDVLIVTERALAADCVERLKRTLDISYRMAGIVYVDPAEEAGESLAEGTSDPEQTVSAGAGQAEEAASDPADTRSERVKGVPVVADRETIRQVTTSMPFDEVFINTPADTQTQMRDILEVFAEMGVAVHYCLEAERLPFADSTMEMFGNYSVISYTRGTGRHRGLFLKRLLDIIGGLVGVIITAILTPILAVVIKADSPGPVFFKQTRVGRNGRRFTIYKFRTMVADAEAQKKALEAKNEMRGLMFKMQADPRVTKVGAFLRKTSLDEFPQFYNILRGEMSLVGTRPPTEQEFERYDPYYRRRLSMTPGLTGMWQVSGRSDIDNFDDVVKLDLEYIDHWSPGLDVQILLKTVLVVLRGRGAR